MTNATESGAVRVEYEAWIPRIAELTGVRLENGGSALPGTLLLAPSGTELSEPEKRDLLAVVKNRLLGPTGRASALKIRSQIDRLDGDSLLPLLYAVRLVSADYGGTNVFWPHFKEWILGESFVKDWDISNQIAPALTRAWMRLHRATDGALYMPSEGPRNIKWPVAHAGLVYTDTNDPHDPLIQYGCELRDEEPTVIHEILFAEPQDFLQDLSTWITHSPDTALTHLARRLLDDNIAPLIADLAQRQLRESYFDLPCEPGRAARSPIIERPSARTVFDATRDRLLLRIHAGAFRGRSSGELRIGDNVRSLIGHFDSLHGSQRFREETVILTEGSWPELVQLRIEDLDLTFSLRPTARPFIGNKGALLCEADTGRQTRRWENNGAYTLIAEHGVAEDIQIAGCLSISLAGAEAVFGFSSQRAYPAVSIRFADATSWDDEATEINEYLEDMSAQFRIPSSREVFSPSVVPVAAMSATDSGIRGFERSDLLFRLEPPDLSWAEASLEQWDPRTLTFELIDAVEPVDGMDSKIVGFEALPTEHRYRVVAGGAHLDFEVTADEQKPFQERDLTLSTTGEMATRDVEVVRLPGDSISLHATGPPEAGVALVAETPAGTIRRRLDLDVDGRGEFNLASLDLPPGTLSLTTRFLGRKSNHLRLIDGAYVASDAWELRPDTGEFEAWIEGFAEDDVVAHLDIVGSRPWLGEIVRHTHKTRFGRFAVNEIAKADWSPQWLILSLDGSLPVLIEPWPYEGQAYRGGRGHRRFTAEDFGPAVHPTWNSLTHDLLRTSLPSSLEMLVDATSIARFAAEHPAIRQPQVWRIVESKIDMEAFAESRIPLTAVLSDDPTSGAVNVNRQASLVKTKSGWRLTYGAEAIELFVEETVVFGIYEFLPIDDRPLSACGSCDALMPTPKAAEDHLGSGPRSRCRSIRVVVDSPTGVVMYKGRASDLIHQVGALLIEGMQGGLGPPATLTPLVEEIRASFRDQKIPQEGRQKILLDGINLALDIVEMFENQTRVVDLDRLADALSGKSARGSVAMAVLSRTNILGRQS